MENVRDDSPDPETGRSRSRNPRKSDTGGINGYTLLSILVLSGFGLGLLIFGDRSKMSPITFSMVWFFGTATIVLGIIMAFAFKTRRELVPKIVVCLAQWFAIILIYENLDVISVHISSALADPMLRSMDTVVFGDTPSIIIDKMGLVTPSMTLLLTAAYVLVYVLFPPFFALYLLWKSNELELSKYLCVVSVVCMAGFLVYFLVPAIGPALYYNNEFTSSLGTKLVINSLEGYPKNAFPSMHACLIAVFSIFAYRNDKRIFWLTLPFVMAMIFSTVYLREHYVIDLIGGFALAILAYIALINPTVESYLSKPLRGFRISAAAPDRG